MPEDFWGGRKGADVYRATSKILEPVDNGWFLGSFDYSLAFDHVRPALVCGLMKYLGMPVGLADMLLALWGQQERYLQLHGCTARQPELVSTSIPQGDPFSMLAMSLLLTVPYRDLKAQHEAAVWMRYVDDRTWVAPTARQCVLIGHQWRQWSLTLGLEENEAKDQYHHRNPSGRIKLLATGLEGQKNTPWPKILGVTLAPSSHRKTLGAERIRLRAAAWVLKRVRCLPVNLATQARVAGVSGVSKAAFGWMCRLPTLSETRPFDWKVAMSCRVAPS